MKKFFFCIYINDKQLLSKTQRKIPKKARERFQNLSEQENEKGVKKAREKYHNLKKKKKKNCQYNNNLSEDQKQKLVDYMRNYYLTHK